MRVALKTKNKGIKVETYTCRKCDEPIKAGDKYYQWQHKHQQPSRQHETHGAPRQSELCTGKMSGVYAAVEEVGDAIDVASRTKDASGLEDALNSAAESVREVAQEYEDNRSNMPDALQDGPTGTDMQEKSEALNEFADELESAASETAVEENDEPDTMDDHTESCATNKEDDAADKKADEDAACDCGYDDAEAKHYEWEQERDDAIQAAIDRAQEALDSLSI